MFTRLETIQNQNKKSFKYLYIYNGSFLVAASFICLNS